MTAEWTVSMEQYDYDGNLEQKPRTPPMKGASSNDGPHCLTSGLSTENAGLEGRPTLHGGSRTFTMAELLVASSSDLPSRKDNLSHLRYEATACTIWIDFTPDHRAFALV